MDAPARSFDRAFARTYAAWERFAAGDGDASDVPPAIAMSWYRCRDVYRIDPTRARPAPAPDAADPADPAGRPVHGGVLARLGALGAALASRTGNRVATVTDGHGTVLATWGDGPTRRRAPDAGLDPALAWSEPVAGTNGVGTSLVARRVCSVRGPEHWSTALHEWSCTGVAFADPVTGAPLATLTLASWREMVPIRPVDLLVATAPVAALLQGTAAHHGRRIATAFAELERRTTGPLLALDLAGRVVAANTAARRRGAVPGEYATGRTPGPRDIHSLGHVAPDVRERVRDDPGWRGTVSLRSAVTDEDETFRVIPVVAGADPIAFLACTDARAGCGEPLDRVPAPRRGGRPQRVPAVGPGGQIVVLNPREIRSARADGHAVWFATDHGPRRATRRGIDLVERDLAGAGFLRVHRSHLVNVARIRDVARDGDRLVISTAPEERIPVSRRHVPAVRRALGI
ncbi:Fis family transcriptional regulator [Actinomycetospora sp. NBRC 106375]|uniref:DNA-binding protein n=1 Tax=Actinomycetospora sp. NBRC 106375 TaxID=3032207 RepID=UPI0024A4F083|nr:DNA-binding protein [Actinomycetospora sp. NBRC 106375]GLZ45338.1 Fis family transcriptional regulator [Actinomycetospora sp. NBRC 106375]